LNLPFTKLQGLGNDFVVLDSALLQEFAGRQVVEQWKQLAPTWARVLCNRNFGVGADGLIVLFDKFAKNVKVPDFVQKYPGSEDVRYAWTYTNSDGSWSSTCGNGLRCAALFLQESASAVSTRPVEFAEFVIATSSGPVPVRFVDQEMIETDFGAPVLSGHNIPTSWHTATCVQKSIEITCFNPSYKVAATAVGFGNPHCVIFDDLLGNGNSQLSRSDRESLTAVAKNLQANSLFPEGVNVEFATVHSREKVSADIFERGCGWTLACGTGAAATLVAGVLENRLARNCEIVLPGGSAFVTWDEKDNHVRLRGPARVVFRGHFDVKSVAEGALIKEIREVVA
jgi:diaminopimelate epimerase